MLPGGFVDVSVVTLNIVVNDVVTNDGDNNVVVTTLIVDVGSKIDDCFDIIAVGIVVIVVDVFIEDVLVIKVVGFGDIDGFVVSVVCLGIAENSLSIELISYSERSDKILIRTK